MTEQFGSDWLGKRLCERYEIRRELGKAIGRRTLLAKDIQTQRDVVIKLLTFGSDFEWANLRLFEREGEVLKSLKHDGIPNYLDYFEIDLPQVKGYALVQSYVNGRSLQEQLKSGHTFNEAEVIDIAQRLLAILQYLHSQTPPIIHRDLKPSNILLGERSGHSQGKLYLVDFGSVQAPYVNPSGTLTIVGTYGYMPPEQFGGRAEPASDIYSLGATLIYLVTGCHPADLPQHSLRIRFEAKATQINLSVRKWLRWLTAPEINQRPASASEALQGLKTMLESGTLNELSGNYLSQSRILVNRQEERLDIVLPPKGFQPKQVSSWLNLLVLGVTFSIASFISGMIVWFPMLIMYGVLGNFIFVLQLVSSIASITSGFMAVILIPTPARNKLLHQLHLCLDDHGLSIYRESIFLWRFRRVLFQVKWVEIEGLAWGDAQNTLEICGISSRYRLNRQKLGLTITEFKWLAQELSDGLGVGLSVGNRAKLRQEARGRRV